MKKILFLFAGLIFGFAIGRLSSFYPERASDVRSGLNIHSVTGFIESTRSFELSERPVLTIEHILWYDRHSRIFAIDKGVLDADILEGTVRWEYGYMLAVTVNSEVIFGVMYTDKGITPSDMRSITGPTVSADGAAFYGDKENLGGYDGSIAGVFSIYWPGLHWGGPLDERIYAELEREERLLEQISDRQVLAELENAVGQTIHSQFTVEELSIVTFEPTVERTASHDPIIVYIGDKNTGKFITRFTHSFSVPVSFIMDAGEYSLFVSGGGFVRDYYIVSVIAIPML